MVDLIRMKEQQSKQIDPYKIDLTSFPEEVNEYIKVRVKSSIKWLYAKIKLQKFSKRS